MKHPELVQTAISSLNAVADDNGTGLEARLASLEELQGEVETLIDNIESELADEEDEDEDGDLDEDRDDTDLDDEE